MTVGERIKLLRESKKWSQSKLGDRVGAKQNTVSSWESDRTRPDPDKLALLARHLGESESFILGLSGPSDDPEEILLIGYIGAGAEFIGIDDHEKGAGLDTVSVGAKCPPGSVAVQVRGGSMIPVYYDGDILVYSDKRQDIDSFLNRRCVVKLADDRILVKTVTRGTDGYYTLSSFNAQPIEDVAIEWVAKIEVVVPR